MDVSKMTISKMISYHYENRKTSPCLHNIIYFELAPPMGFIPEHLLTTFILWNNILKGMLEGFWNWVREHGLRTSIVRNMIKPTEEGNTSYLKSDRRFHSEELLNVLKFCIKKCRSTSYCFLTKCESIWNSSPITYFSNILGLFLPFIEIGVSPPPSHT